MAGGQDQVHKSAHFLLIAWTDNARARSQAAKYRRKKQRDSGNPMRISTGNLRYGIVVGSPGGPANLEPMCPISAVRGLIDQAAAQARGHDQWSRWQGRGDTAVADPSDRDAQANFAPARQPLRRQEQGQGHAAASRWQGAGETAAAESSVRDAWQWQSGWNAEHSEEGWIGGAVGASSTWSWPAWKWDRW